MVDLHRVTRHHGVVPHPPKPLILQKNEINVFHHHHHPHHHPHPHLLYLEDEQLLSEDGQSVEASVTDAGFGVGVGGLGPLGRAVRAGVAVVLAWV